METEELIGSCKQVSELMFALASYRMSVSQQILAGILGAILAAILVAILAYRI